MTTAATNGTSTAADSTPDIRGFEIPRPQMLRAVVRLEGISSLIMHKWSAKQLKQLEDSQTGKPKEQRTAKIPEQEARDAAYVVPGREDWEDGKEGKYCFPAPAFKHAFLYGVSQLDDVKKFPKTKATGWVFIDSDPVLDFESCMMRTDVGRNPTQMVYRLEFHGWGCDLPITYNANTITLEQIAALFDLGGTGGVGEWRPTSPKNKSGDHGRFRVLGVEGEARS